MVAHRATHPTAPGRRPAGDLIEAVLDNMRRNLEPLKYSTLAPSRYLVYVHPTEFRRLEGILPILAAQTIRALAEELEVLNRTSRLRRIAGRVLGKGETQVQNAGDWHVEVLPDPDGLVGEGDILVDSELLLPESPELGVGERTRRFTTVRTGQQTSSRERTIERTSAGQVGAAFARIAYDDNEGHHTFDVVKESISIGRGGVTYPVDIRIATLVDVSREHARIRRDPASGHFFLIDLSSLGTTVNGRHVPSGIEEVDGTRRENGSETQLPDRARIGLAETVYLDFTKVR